MYLNFPTKFEIDYPEKNDTYYASENTNMRYKLLEVCKGYCMYCGCLLLQVGSSYRGKKYNCHYGELEHTVEKSQPHLALFVKPTKNKRRESFALTHCKFNMGLACPVCNRKRKKATAIIFNDIQHFQTITDKSIVKKNKQNNCSPTYHSYVSLCKNKMDSKCIEPCPFLLDCEKRHEDIHKLIKLPRNVDNYSISYDYIEGLFIPHEKHKGDRYAFNLISSHIEQFELNMVNSGYVTVKNIAQVLKNTVDLNTVVDILQPHVLGDIFIKRLGKMDERMRKVVCQHIVDKGSNPRKKKPIREI